MKHLDDLRNHSPLASALIAVAALSSLAPACDGEDSTTGKRVTHATVITAGPEAAGGFTNAFGWSVTLSRAYLSVGALYYFDGAPVTARLIRPWPDRLARLLIPEAHAHPGHYQPGNALGEMTAKTSVDLVAGPAALGPSPGVSGVYRSARIDLASPSAGPFAGELGQFVVVVEGVAEQAGEERPFRAEAAAADVVDTDGEPAVAGCVFEEADVQEDGTVTVTIKPSVWLDQIDFAELPASADGQPVLLEPGSVPHRAFTRGLKKGTGYAFSYAPGTGGNP